MSEAAEYAMRAGHLKGDMGRAATFLRSAFRLLETRCYPSERWERAMDELDQETADAFSEAVDLFRLAKHTLEEAGC